MHYVMVTSEPSMVGRTRWFAVTESFTASDGKRIQEIMEANDRESCDDSLQLLLTKHKHGCHNATAMVVFGTTNSVSISAESIQRLKIHEAYLCEVGARLVASEVGKFLAHELLSDTQEVSAAEVEQARTRALRGLE